MRFTFILLSSVCFLSFNWAQNGDFSQSPKFKIEKQQQLKGDFRFTKKWSYSEDIVLEKNKFGDLLCDDNFDYSVPKYFFYKNGKLKDKYKKLYYSKIDTSHYNFTALIKDTDVWCYEWIGTNFANSYKVKDTIFLATQMNDGNHSSFQFKIIADSVQSINYLNSIIRHNGINQYVFPATIGSFIVDETFLNKGILRAYFDFEYNNTSQPTKKIFVRGWVSVKIETR